MTTTLIIGPMGNERVVDAAMMKLNIHATNAGKERKGMKI
jgi:hypothetical protein